MKSELCSITSDIISLIRYLFIWSYLSLVITVKIFSISLFSLWMSVLIFSSPFLTPFLFFWQNLDCLPSFVFQDRQASAQVVNDNVSDEYGNSILITVSYQGTIGISYSPGQWDLRESVLWMWKLLERFSYCYKRILWKETVPFFLFGLTCVPVVYGTITNPLSAIRG